jgi:hypothetical protein
LDARNRDQGPGGRDQERDAIRVVYTIFSLKNRQRSRGILKTDP